MAQLPEESLWDPDGSTINYGRTRTSIDALDLARPAKFGWVPGPPELCVTHAVNQQGGPQAEGSFSVVSGALSDLGTAITMPPTEYPRTLTRTDVIAMAAVQNFGIGHLDEAGCAPQRLRPEYNGPRRFRIIREHWWMCKGTTGPPAVHEEGEWVFTARPVTLCHIRWNAERACMHYSASNIPPRYHRRYSQVKEPASRNRQKWPRPKRRRKLPCSGGFLEPEPQGF